MALFVFFASTPKCQERLPVADLTHFENGARTCPTRRSIIERSALARCYLLIIRSRNTLQTICSATFAPFLSCYFFFFLFFYDDAMTGISRTRTTTTMTGRPHHTTPELVSEFNKRCFLRSRCSMEMWCPDEKGRESWDWVGPPWEHDSTPQRGVDPRGTFASLQHPQIGLLVLLLLLSGSLFQKKYISRGADLSQKCFR